MFAKDKWLIHIETDLALVVSKAQLDEYNIMNPTTIAVGIYIYYDHIVCLIIML